jgi:hypothetical protein
VGAMVFILCGADAAASDWRIASGHGLLGLSDTQATW